MTEENKDQIPYYGDPNMLIDLRDHEDEFSARTINWMKYAEFFHLGDILRNYQQSLLRIPNFGRKSLNELETFLQKVGNYKIPEYSNKTGQAAPSPQSFGDDKSKIVEMYGLDNDAEPTFKPAPRQKGLLPTHFKSGDLTTISFTHFKDTKEYHVTIQLPEKFNNLVEDEHVKLGATGALINHTGAENIKQDANKITLVYSDNARKRAPTFNMNDISKQVSEALNELTNHALPEIEQHMKSLPTPQARMEARNRYGFKLKR